MSPTVCQTWQEVRALIILCTFCGGVQLEMYWLMFFKLSVPYEVFAWILYYVAPKVTGRAQGLGMKYCMNSTDRKFAKLVRYLGFIWQFHFQFSFTNFFFKIAMNCVINIAELLKNVFPWRYIANSVSFQECWCCGMDLWASTAFLIRIILLVTLYICVDVKEDLCGSSWTQNVSNLTGKSNSSQNNNVNITLVRARGCSGINWVRYSYLTLCIECTSGILAHTYKCLFKWPLASSIKKN